MRKNQKLLGRSHNLEEVMTAWKCISNGPKTILISAAPGSGKTALIQATYAELGAMNEKQDYWPLELASRGHSEQLVPNFATDESLSTSIPPWLWLAIRCTEPEPSQITSPVFFDALRRQLSVHLVGLIQALNKRNRNKQLAKSALGFLTSFALPGSSQAIELVNTVLDSSGDVLSAKSFISAVKESRLSRQNTDISLQQVMNEEGERIEHEASKVIESLINDYKVPIILAVDDFHQIDATSLVIFQQLMKRAHKHNWPILFLFTVTEDALRHHKLYGGLPEVNQFINELREDPNADFPQTLELPLQPLDRDLQLSLVESFIPQSTAAHRAALVDKADGNLKMLHDFIREIQQSPGWLSDDGRLAVSAEELNAGITSEIIEIARQRLRRAPKDLREILIWGSGQGRLFDVELLQQVLDKLNKDMDLNLNLTQAERDFGFIAKSQFDDVEVAEFYRSEFYEASSEFFRTHPRGNYHLQTIAHLMFAYTQTESWLGHTDESQLALLNRLMQLKPLFNPTGEHDQQLAELLMTAALKKLSKGDYTNAEKLAETILLLTNVGLDLINQAFQVLVRSAYLEGNADKERNHLQRWKVDARGLKFPRLIMQATLHMREGQGHQSLLCAEEALAEAKSKDEYVEALLKQAHCFWSAGSPQHAYETISHVEKELEQGHNKPWLEAQLQHISSLVLHDLEKNQQVIFRAESNYLDARNNNDVYDEIIAQVNLADSYWAVGLMTTAENLLREALEKAEKSGLDHTIDIAMSCLANVLAEKGVEAESYKLYESSIALAKKLQHKWDLLYAEIYFQLLASDKQPANSYEALTQLAEKAHENNYTYLVALANAFRLIIDERHQLDRTLETTYSDDIKAIPLFRAYLSAYQVLAADTPDESHTQELLNTLGKCEGLKGRRNFVIRALDKILETQTVTQIQIEFIERWKARFGCKYEADEEPLYQPCNFKTCEARCCYDGVYLSHHDEKKIEQAVKNYPDYFSHLPEAYIVDGSWGSISGRKTAIRPHTYQSPDFPQHFTQTRCVFAYADGACSLHTLALDKGFPIKDAKPDSCLAFPFRSENEDLLAYDEQDASHLGLRYPGYENFTPCAQPRQGGCAAGKAYPGEVIFITRNHQ